MCQSFCSLGSSLNFAPLTARHSFYVERNSYLKVNDGFPSCWGTVSGLLYCMFPSTPTWAQYFDNGASLVKSYTISLCLVSGCEIMFWDFKGIFIYENLYGSECIMKILVDRKNLELSLLQSLLLRLFINLF